MPSEFCTNLTGITTEQVSNTHGLGQVLTSFDGLLKYHKVHIAASVQTIMNALDYICAVTCGDWDLKTQLPEECAAKGLIVPPYLEHLLNVKHPFCTCIIGKKTGLAGYVYMTGMLSRFKDSKINFN